MSVQEPTPGWSVPITDPVSAPKGPRFIDQLILKVIVDERDLPFGRLWLQALFFGAPAALALFLWRDFPIWAGVAYLAMIFLVFVDRFILAAHNTSHRRFWRRGYEWMHAPVTFVFGPLFGHTPFTYYCHHVGMHHVEENLGTDLSSTMRFRRDSAFDFLRYFLRFFILSVVELPIYFYKRRRFRLMRRVLFGEISFALAIIALGSINFQATLFVLILPVTIVRFLMMAGNWAQHAFIDPAAPHDAYKSSITCINTRYNRRCYNDGYHIGHHLSPTRHWTEMPTDYQATIAEYARNKAFVFNGVDYFQIWLMLMLKQKNLLAKYYVPLEGSPTREEIVSMFNARLLPIAGQSMDSPPVREEQATAA
jgi:fatty acid desaturase